MICRAAAGLETGQVLGSSTAMPRRATSAEVDAILRTAIATTQVRDGARAGALLDTPSRNIALAGIGLLLLLPFGVGAWGRKK